MRPAAGRPTMFRQPWSERDWADAASGFITTLGLGTPAVAGFSLGSMLALLLARDHPA